MSSDGRPSRRARLRALLRDRSGVSAIEFAATLPAIVVIILGTVDLGNLVQQRMKLADAVHAGGLYAVSFPADTAGIQRSVTANLPAGWTDVTAGTDGGKCYCWSAGGGEVSANCADDPVCAAGTIPERFLTITASRPFSPLLLGSLATSVSASYVTRVQ